MPNEYNVNNTSMHSIILGNPEMAGNGGSGIRDFENKGTADHSYREVSTSGGVKTYPGSITAYIPEEAAGKITRIHDGGMLTGSKILEEIEAGHIRITPFDATKVNPNSYNLTLNNTLLVYKDSIIDFKKENPTNRIIIPESGLVLKPNTLYIGRTNERCWTDRYIPQLDGRSSIGRLGITIHVTAGYGDIGWDGTWTLEIMAIHPVRIYPNIEFCQISYHTPYGLTNIQYQGRYQGQIEPTASKSSLDKKVYV